MSVEEASPDQGGRDASIHDNMMVHILSVLNNPGLGRSWHRKGSQGP